MATNILDIYNRLYQASDNIKGETVDYIRGFQACVYMLKMALKKFEHINLHVENKRLSRELYLAQLALDDRYEDRHVLKSQVDELKQELNQYRARRHKVNGEMVDLNVVEFDACGQTFRFASTATNEEISELWSEAEKTAFTGRVKHPSDVKARIMQFYRSKGFKCVA